MLATSIVFFGERCVLVCDAKCSKAWGINTRPSVQLSDDENDSAFLADGELDEAPIDPGTYEGGYGKPRNKEERHNKWCARECERSRIAKAGVDFQLPDYISRNYNMPWLHNDRPD